MQDTEILIAGGGIAGLATSLGLTRNGRQAHVLEQAPAFEEFGAGLQLGPNAVKALKLLGAWESVAPACVIPSEIHVRDGRSGKLLQRVNLGRDFENEFGAPYRVIHRADLHQGLLATAQANPGITLQTNAQIVAISTATTSLTLHSRSTFSAQTIIGADGVNSLIRKHIQAEDGYGYPRQILHRALIPFAQVPITVSSDVVTLWLLPQAHIVHYAVSNWKSFNIVAVIEGDEISPALLARDVCQPLFDILNAPQSWTPWPGRDVVPNPKWFDTQTLLLGDAAHATLPYLAQGAAMSLEDAAQLSLISKNEKNIATCFTAFRNCRFARTRRIQETSRKQGAIYHATGAKRLSRNLVMKVMSSDFLLKRLSWIYHWTPTE